MNDPFLDDLKSRLDIVDIIRKYTEPKKSGKNFVAKSPFRNERTPSFSISPDKQLWYDFGAGEGGDMISFIEKIENISFQEAVETLADIAGVKVPKNITHTSTTHVIKKDISNLHKEACTFFIEALKKDPRTQKYLKDRDISTDTIKEWQLGYGGDISDGLTKHLFGKGFSEKSIGQSGVSFEREFGDKRMKDRFAQRLIIPIQESRYGDIVAFGGRDLSGEKKVSKYVNSPENPVYNKSSILYGLWQAKKIISKKDFVILVEGYFDVISAHQAGLCNTVAACGTAITEAHLRCIKLLTKNIYLAFDADLAGKKATLRGVELCLEFDLNPFIVEIKNGKDLDELARTDSKELIKTVENAEYACSFLLKRFSEKLLDGTISGEKKMLDAFFPILKLVNSPLEKDHLIEDISKHLKRPKTVIEAEFQKFVAKNPRTFLKPKFESSTQKKFTREEVFVGFISSNWGLFSEKINDEVIACLKEPKSQNILTKRKAETLLSEEEKSLLLSWELYNDNLYKDIPSESILERDFQIFIQWLNVQREKSIRLEEAKGILLKIANRS